MKMTTSEAAKIRTGDRLFWNDPDDGVCSKAITVAHVRLHGDGEDAFVRLVAEDGSEIECLPSELESR